MKGEMSNRVGKKSHGKEMGGRKREGEKGKISK